MIPTTIGLVIIVVGLVLLFRPPVEMLGFLFLMSLLAGASAADLPALGHSSLPPATLALGFLVLRVCRRDVRRAGGLGLGLRRNAWLLMFCTYGALTALVLPRIFAGRVYVIPMQRATTIALLAPTSQNLTQAIYLLGTAAAAVSASALASRAEASATLLKVLMAAALIHGLTGVIDVVAAAFHIQGIFEWARNGSYAQLDQEASEFHRIAGLTPEASAYAGIASIFFVFFTELWLRNVKPLWSGMISILTCVMLIASTSSTAYVTIGMYALILALRVSVLPGFIPLGRTFIMITVATAVALGVGFTVLLDPALLSSFRDTILEMTVGKSQSLSGIERQIWARQGWNLFLQTKGLGVGVGSFRSSSLPTSILGSIGPACLIIFGGYALMVLKPWRVSTFKSFGRPDEDVGVAASWAAVLLLVPATVSSPSSDPGLLFAMLAGVALALRNRNTGARLETPTPPLGVSFFSRFPRPPRPEHQLPPTVAPDSLA